MPSFRFPDSVAAFKCSSSGSVAAIFAGLFCAIALTAGLAIDFSRGSTVAVNLQNDLDAALLGAATRAAEGPELTAAAQTYFDENWKQKYGIADDVQISVWKPQDETIAATVSVNVPTTLMALAGIFDIEVSARSEVMLANENLELALVLDTTESMAGAKIDALKASAKALVDLAFAGPESATTVKVSLVPFGNYVNVGMANRDASWMDVPDDTSTTTPICIPDYRDVVGTSNCRDEPYTVWRDGVESTQMGQVCDYEYGPPYTHCWDHVDTTAWFGCAGPREYPLDTMDEDYATPVPGSMNVWCGSELTPLTSDADMLRGNIDAINVSGDTYIPTGLFWGWAALSKDAPFTEAVAYGEKINGIPVQKVMVLMTDGANTRSPDYAAKNHAGYDSVLANNRTAELCTNIKAKGIKVFTVAFDVTDNGIKDILRQCATSPTSFYDADDADELQMAFENIGKALSPIRIAR